jgi:hypothetical protein
MEPTMEPDNQQPLNEYLKPHGKGSRNRRAGVRRAFQIFGFVFLLMGVLFPPFLVFGLASLVLGFVLPKE